MIKNNNSEDSNSEDSKDTLEDNYMLNQFEKDCEEYESVFKAIASVDNWKVGNEDE